MINYMIRKKILFAVLITAFIMSGCIKETYDLNKLSKKIEISPAFSFPVATGDVKIEDIVKPGDTVRFDSDKFIRLFIRKDSVFNLKLEDFYDFSDMVSFESGYVFGEIMMSDFQNTLKLTLNTISMYFSPALRAQFLLLADGGYHDFPAFPNTDVGEHTFTMLAGFENVHLSSGTIEISVKNNLTAPLSGIKIRLYNSTGHTAIGSEVTISSINSGSTKTVTVPLSLPGVTVTNSIIAAIVFTGSPGASNVIIDMDHTVDFTIRGHDLKISAGRLIVPEQILSSLDNADTLDFEPGENIEIEKASITKGEIDYNATSRSNLTASFNFELPTSDRAGSHISKIINLAANSTVTGNINIDNTVIDLNRDSNQPYNRLPVKYEVRISSQGNMVNYSSFDSIHLKISMPDPKVDYMKGYFGQKQENIDPDTITTDLEDILKKITGEFYISNPILRVNYSNSFGIPVGVTLNATGKRDSKSINLDLKPFTIDYPVFPVRDISSSFTIDKSNSKLPDLISLPPVEISLSGSGKMNPSGSGSERNNYVFGNSRFLASLEIEVPVELRFNNLQFADTVDNFLKPDENENNDDNPFKPENMEYFKLKITSSNGFPLGASLRLKLYNSLTDKILYTVNAPEIIKPAVVDANGKASTPAETVTEINFDAPFFDASKDADKIIFEFTLVTSGGGTKDVKFYSDYMISFKATVIARPDIIFNQ